MAKSLLRYSFSKSKKHFKKLIKLIREHHLYVPGWQMNGWLNFPDYIEEIILCRNGSEPVAVGVRRSDKCSITAGMFVKEAYRKQGIGSQLLDYLATRSPVPLKVASGTDEKFYPKRKRKYKLNILW